MSRCGTRRCTYWRHDDGAATVWVLAVAAMVCALSAVGLGLTEVRLVRQQVATAADLSALAAAARLPLVGLGCAEAERVARVQGAQLASCTSDGTTVDVVVVRDLGGLWGALGVVSVRSRAGPPGAR